MKMHGQNHIKFGYLHMIREPSDNQGSDYTLITNFDALIIIYS